MSPTKLQFVIEPITTLRDDLILAALPADIQKQLGKIVATGFVLGINRRDITCENGFVDYCLGLKVVNVELD